jgi:hypothetical protein
MKAFVYRGDGLRALEERPKPVIASFGATAVVSSAGGKAVEAVNETFAHAAETRALKVILEV